MLKIFIFIALNILGLLVLILAIMAIFWCIFHIIGKLEERHYSDY